MVGEESLSEARRGGDTSEDTSASVCKARLSRDGTVTSALGVVASGWVFPRFSRRPVPASPRRRQALEWVRHHHRLWREMGHVRRLVKMLKTSSNGDSAGESYRRCPVSDRDPDVLEDIFRIYMSASAQASTDHLPQQLDRPDEQERLAP